MRAEGKCEQPGRGCPIGGVRTGQARISGYRSGWEHRELVVRSTLRDPGCPNRHSGHTCGKPDPLRFTALLAAGLLLCEAVFQKDSCRVYAKDGWLAPRRHSKAFGLLKIRFYELPQLAPGSAHAPFPSGTSQLENTSRFLELRSLRERRMLQKTVELDHSPQR